MLEVVHALGVGARLGADALPLGGRRDERLEAGAQCLLRRAHDRHARAELALGALDGLVVEERDDRLSERHALDREEPVPPRVQLIDDDVRLAVALERLVVVEALDEDEVGVEPFARLEHVLRSLASPGRRRVEDHGARPVGGRRRHDGLHVDPGRDHLGLGHPADRVVRTDDLGAGLLSEREVGRCLAADVGAEVVHHGLLAQRAQDRKLHRLRHERQPEVEVEDVGAREQAQEGRPLRRLLSDEAAAALERPVGLRVERVAVEDHELRVDAAPAQCLDVRPRHAGRVDGAVDDPQPPFGVRHRIRQGQRVTNRCRVGHRREAGRCLAYRGSPGCGRGRVGRSGVDARRDGV